MTMRCPAKSRQGMALYISVLSTALLVSLLGLSALTIVRIERMKMAVTTDRRTARLNATSAVELALRVIANNELRSIRRQEGDG